LNSSGDWWLGDRPLLRPGRRPPSDAALAMELGADAVLVNTAIALAQDPPLMAEAIRQGGRRRAQGLPGGPDPAPALRLGQLPDQRGLAAQLSPGSRLPLPAAMAVVTDAAGGLHAVRNGPNVLQLRDPGARISRLEEEAYRLVKWAGNRLGPALPRRALTTGVHLTHRAPPPTVCPALCAQ
jgi:Thiazole biosynthesis protein ThiG